MADLRRVGIKVYVIGHPYDLLMRWSKRWWIVEVKYDDGGFTPSQVKDMAELAVLEGGYCPVIVARNTQDVFWALGLNKNGK